MEELAKADPDFAKLWNRVLVKRNVKRSSMVANNERPTRAEVIEACEKDYYYQRLYASARERYERYLKVFETVVALMMPEIDPPGYGRTPR